MTILDRKAAEQELAAGPGRRAVVVRGKRANLAACGELEPYPGWDGRWLQLVTARYPLGVSPRTAYWVVSPDIVQVVPRSVESAARGQTCWWVLMVVDALGACQIGACPPEDLLETLEAVGSDAATCARIDAICAEWHGRRAGHRGRDAKRLARGAVRPLLVGAAPLLARRREEWVEFLESCASGSDSAEAGS